MHGSGWIRGALGIWTVVGVLLVALLVVLISKVSAK